MMVMMMMMGLMISLALEFEKHAKQTRLVTFYMINSTLGDFTEIHVFELLWCCEYVFDWWEVIPTVSLAMGYKLASHCNSLIYQKKISTYLCMCLLCELPKNKCVCVLAHLSFF
uniref:NADH:quinone oxidoreductase/Mrp antiporter membrane subunit domain-containing protein n=1 Tax=Populus trichocarpa TaxID=3694 RepID=A0A2K2CCP0_POPTR